MERRRRRDPGDRDDERRRQAAQAPGAGDDRPHAWSTSTSRSATATATVPFVSGTPISPRLEIAPLDVGPTMRDRRVVAGAPRSSQRHRAVVAGHARRARRRRPPTRPTSAARSTTSTRRCCTARCTCRPPKAPQFREAVADELAALIDGRRWAHARAVHQLEGDGPRRRGGARQGRRPDPHPARPAQAGAGAGVRRLGGDVPVRDHRLVPGRRRARAARSSLVVIDKLPFPRPDDPLLSARRERLGPAAFGAIDVPRAATMLAQACGRLIRTATDRGVVAVLDPRLGKAGYRWDIVKALPPMQRTRHRADAEAFLRAIRDDDGASYRRTAWVSSSGRKPPVASPPSRSTRSTTATRSRTSS